MVDPLFSAPSTQVGGLHHAIIRCHEGPSTTPACRPLRQQGLNITARPAHRHAPLLCAVLLAAVAHRLHMTGCGSQQAAVAGQWTAPPSQSRTAVCCALPPVCRSATSRARQLLHAAFSASTTQQGQDGCAQGEAGTSGGQQAVSHWSNPSFPRHVGPQAPVSSPCSIIAAPISSGSGLQSATLSPGPAATQLLTHRMLARCRLVQAAVAFLQGHSLLQEGKHVKADLRQGTVCRCVFSLCTFTNCPRLPSRAPANPAQTWHLRWIMSLETCQPTARSSLSWAGK